MFSSTTMESSTRMPTTSERAMSVIRLSEKPITYMRMNVEIIDVGSATITISEERRLCRNTSITPATITTASSRSNFTASAEASV
jgi:hypothetical protein